jgi:GNAT superfamily N-acetyltransferase
MNRTQARVGKSGWPPHVDRPAAPRLDLLRDGAAAIRAVCPADMPALSDFFAGLSARTRYLRFFAPITPGPAMLRLLSGGTGNTDALIAVHGAAIVGHAMAVDRPCDAGPEGRTGLEETRAWTTDVGVVVADAWQSRGLGSALMRALIARAWTRGVTSVAMDVLRDNRRVLAMIAGHWPSARVDHTPDCTTIWLTLPRSRPGQGTQRCLFLAMI